MKYFLQSILLFFLIVPVYAVEIYGHRGARGLAPENTLIGYKTAISLGVDAVDLDVTLTKDKIVVISHGIALNPLFTRGQNKEWLSTDKILIKNLSYAELRQYDVGRIKPNTAYAKLFPKQKAVDNTPIPTLKAMIQYVKKVGSPTTKFQIELKMDPVNPSDTVSPLELATAVVKVINEEGIAERTEMQSFDWRCLLAVQKIAPNIPTAYLTDIKRTKLMYNKDPKIAGLWTAGYLLKNYHYSFPQMIKALGGKLWDPQDVQVTRENLAEAHGLGLRVVVWSSADYNKTDVNVALSKKLIAWGVDGIITDRPDKFLVRPRPHCHCERSEAI